MHVAIALWDHSTREQATVGKTDASDEDETPNERARRCCSSPYRAVHGSSQTVGSRRLQQLPRSSLVEGDDGAHVVFADRAVDERGDEDSPQALHAVKVRERLVGKVPGTGERGRRQIDASLENVAFVFYSHVKHS